MKIKFLILSLLLFQQLLAQDFVFYSNLKSFLNNNPAFVGFENVVNVDIQYRQQFLGNINDYYYGAIFLETPLSFSKLKRYGDLGIAVFNESDGKLDVIGATGIVIDYAYTFYLKEDFSVTASLASGFINKYINLNNLTTGSQFDLYTGFNPDLPINESLINGNHFYIDLSTGVLFTKYSKDGYKYFIGLSAYHLNKPLSGFWTDSYFVPVEYNFHIGAVIYQVNNFFIESFTNLVYLNNFISVAQFLTFNRRLSKPYQDYRLISKIGIIYPYALAVQFGLRTKNFHYFIGYDSNNLSMTSSLKHSGFELWLGWHKYLNNSEKNDNDFQVGKRYKF